MASHQICVLPAGRSARHPAPQQHWALEAPRAPGASVSVGFVPGKWRFQHGVAMKNVDFMGCLAMDKWWFYMDFMWLWKMWMFSEIWRFYGFFRWTIRVFSCGITIFLNKHVFFFEVDCWWTIIQFYDEQWINIQSNKSPTSTYGEICCLFFFLWRFDTIFHGRTRLCLLYL